MKKTVKIVIITVTTAIAFLFQSTDYLYAIGNFSLGVNTGATYDPNYLENDINTF